MCVTLSGIKEIIHSTLFFFSSLLFQTKGLFYPHWPLMSANKLVCKNPSKLLCWRLNFICSWIASEKCLGRVRRPSLGSKKRHQNWADLGVFCRVLMMSHSRAWPGCCGGWALGTAGWWSATSWSSSDHQRQTPVSNDPLYIPGQRSHSWWYFTFLLSLISLSVFFNWLAGNCQLIWTQTKKKISVYWPGVILIKKAGRVTSPFWNLFKDYAAWSELLCSQYLLYLLPSFRASVLGPLNYPAISKMWK